MIMFTSIDTQGARVFIFSFDTQKLIRASPIRQITLQCSQSQGTERTLEGAKSIQG
jgi:hypothetical protein